MTNPLDMTGRRYLITGAASGIGRATAVLLSQLGAELLLADQNGEGLADTQADCSSATYVLQLDLADTQSVKPALDRAVVEFGKLNGFAHIAGIPCICPLKVITEEMVSRVYQVNTYAAIELAKLISSKKYYTGEHGSFVLISSVYGVVGSAANVGYAMSKAGIIGITKALAMELASRCIRVNCVAPGFVKSNMMGKNSFRFGVDYMENLERLHPLGLGSPVDIANGIAFLLSDMSSWMTGAVVNIDGGFTAQ